MLSRRQALLGLGLLLGGCGSGSSAADDPGATPAAGTLDPAKRPFVDAVDALFDVLVPAKKDSPGARSTGVDDVMAIDRFAALAAGLGFVPAASDAALEKLGGALRVALNADLDALASLEKPLTPFKNLPRASMDAVVARAWDDPAQKVPLAVVRAACMVAWLGAVTSDLGLVAIGFPPYEDFAKGLACSGYPASGEDYTFNELPPPSPGDDLTGVLDADGDLV